MSICIFLSTGYHFSSRKYALHYGVITRTYYLNRGRETIRYSA